jgi:hypothetical protein
VRKKEEGLQVSYNRQVKNTIRGMNETWVRCHPNNDEENATNQNEGEAIVVSFSQKGKK